MNIPLNIDWQQILLHFFNFSILVGGLYLLLFKPVKDVYKRQGHHCRSKGLCLRSPARRLPRPLAQPR